MIGRKPDLPGIPAGIDPIARIAHIIFMIAVEKSRLGKCFVPIRLPRRQEISIDADSSVPRVILGIDPQRRVRIVGPLQVAGDRVIYLEGDLEFFIGGNTAVWISGAIVRDL